MLFLFKFMLYANYYNLDESFYMALLERIIFAVLVHVYGYCAFNSIAETGQ